ncbi:MAG TPA: MoaD/ThiS family protein [Acidobacteriota bacterium]|nr:MoaD/ThiS family protein [Acidobacteriota bacterium]
MTGTVTVTIQLFAIYRELLGQSEMTARIDADQSVADLFGQILGQRTTPKLREATLFAVNEEYVPADTPLKDGDRVAFIPPVSGG